MSLSSELVKLSPFLAGSVSDGQSPETEAKLGDFPVDGVIYADSDKALVSGKDFRSGRPARFAVFPKRDFDLAELVMRLRIEHPNMDVFERIETVNGHPVVVLGAIKAMPLDKVETQRRIPVKHAVRIAREVLEALAAGHERGFVHGFLSPRWVWLESSQARGRLVGMGWRSLEPPGAGELTAFLTGRSTELPAPEVAEGKSADAKSDLFQAGSILYRMLTTRDPFQADSPLAAIRALAVMDPLPPSRNGAESSPELDALVMSLLDRDPARRPATAAEAARRLATIESSDLSGAMIEPVDSEASESTPADPDIEIEKEADTVNTASANGHISGKPSESKAEEQGYGLMDSLGATGHSHSVDSIELLPIDDEYEPISSATRTPKTSPSAKASVASGGASKAGTGLERFPVPLEWIYLADSTVAAVHLCGESQSILVRENSGRIVSISPEGEILNVQNAPEPVKLSAADQTGQLIALIMDRTKLVLLDGDLNLITEKKLHSEPLGLAVDPAGLFVAVSFEGRETQLFTRSGKFACKFETRQPLARMCFVPGSARLLCCTKFDQYLAVDFEAEGRNQLIPVIDWSRNTGVVFGHLHVIGDSGKTLASCNVMGLQRLNEDGENEGTYQLGGTVIEATSDFPGRFFLASTLEGTLLAVNVNGTILWDFDRGGPWRHLAIDPLGRYALAASDSGQVVKMDLSTEAREAGSRPGKVRTITADGVSSGQNVRHPAWSFRIAGETETANGYDLAISDNPVRVAVLDPKKKLDCYLGNGTQAETVAALGGVGRLLKQRDGWLAAGNDRTIVLADLARGSLHRPDLDLVQVTHFDMRPAAYGLAIVQEADRIGRATVAGRWIWRKPLPATAESMVLADDGLIALSLDDGKLIVLDPAGQEISRWNAGEQEAVLVCESAGRHGSNCRWVSYSRQERLLRGHSAECGVLWQVDVPFQGWNLIRTGQGAVISDNSGAALLVDDGGYVLGRRGGESGHLIFGTAADGSSVVLRSERQHVYLTRFDGSPMWRAGVDSQIEAVAFAPRCVAILAAGVLSFIDAHE
jgi:serine/threonine protein kinase